MITTEQAEVTAPVGQVAGDSGSVLDLAEITLSDQVEPAAERDPELKPNVVVINF